MMNLNETPLVDANNLIIPSVNYNVKCLSMGLLMDPGKPVVWRGPLVMSALQRILKGAIWGPLDILIVDTPPGTGDVHLSLAQNVPISGVVLVSTPQTAALDVTKRGAEMYKTFNIDIIGLVENMNHYICSNCQHRNEIFKNSTAKMVDSIGTQILASLPMDQTVIDCCDAGTPMCLKNPQSDFAIAFQSIAKKIEKYVEIRK
jgi:ATP-binding protein involved in chromosome partitioning